MPKYSDDTAIGSNILKNMQQMFLLVIPADPGGGGGGVSPSVQFLSFSRSLEQTFSKQENILDLRMRT